MVESGEGPRGGGEPLLTAAEAASYISEITEQLASLAAGVGFAAIAVALTLAKDLADNVLNGDGHDDEG